jgi:hypothetical protein
VNAGNTRRVRVASYRNDIPSELGAAEYNVACNNKNNHQQHRKGNRSYISLSHENNPFIQVADRGTVGKQHQHPSEYLLHRQRHEKGRQIKTVLNHRIHTAAKHRDHDTNEQNHHKGQGCLAQ